MLFEFKNIIDILKDELINDHYLDETIIIDNVTQDSREITENSFYIARKGERTDGHNYIKDVLAKNRTSSVLAEYIPADVNEQDYGRIITVKNSIKAFEKIARYSRGRLMGTVIGVTGSLGKTTTKDLLYHCLSKFGKAFKNQHSFNNYIGILITMVNTPADTEFAIYEMGMSQKGEMDILVDIVRPNIAILNNIEMAHSEFFKFAEEIADEKTKIFNKYATKAILNLGNKYFDYCYNKVKEKKNIQEILTFAENNIEASINLVDFKIENFTSNTNYKIDGKNYFVISKNLDKNIFLNFMPVLAVARCLNLNLDKMCKEAGDFNTTRGRNNIERAEYNYDGKNVKLTIINGCYNAVNPKAFNSGFELMKLIGNKFGRKVCIFGGIHEAGENSVKFNTGLLEPIIKYKIDLLIIVGDVIKVLYDKIRKVEVDFDYVYFETADIAKQQVKDLLKDNDLVFIKGSKGTHIFEVFNILTNNPMKIFV